MIELIVGILMLWAISVSISLFKINTILDKHERKLYSLIHNINKWRYGEEITCNHCDSDFDGVNGYECPKVELKIRRKKDD